MLYVKTDAGRSEVQARNLALTDGAAAQQIAPTGVRLNALSAIVRQ